MGIIKNGNHKLNMKGRFLRSAFFDEINTDDVLSYI